MKLDKLINSLFNYKRYIIPEDLNSRRIDFVLSVLADIPRKEARNLIEQGFVLLNENPIVFPSKRVLAKDSIILIDRNKFLTKLNKVEIIYEDSGLIVVNKPPFILTNKESSESGESVEEILLKMGKPCYPVHRLDRETSGVVLFARDETTKRYLMDEFKKQRIEKRYLGIVNGVVKKSSAILRGKIGLRREYAATQYGVIERLNGATLLEFFPKTGRTHQIRIQMAGIGNPIVGDKRYCAKFRRQIYFPRQALHSSEMVLIHPVTKKWTRFFAPIPDDMKELITFLKG